MRTDPSCLPLLRLLQLASPALPVGAYSYSQGLERAVEDRIVTDEASAAAWIEDALQFSLAAYEGPCMSAMLDAARRDDRNALQGLNHRFLAARESAELRAETVQLGHSLVRLFEQLQSLPRALELVRAVTEPSYPCAWACAAAAFGVSSRDALAAYLWSWAENQVLAAIKLVPLGQSAGQRVLLRLGSVIAERAPAPGAGFEQWTNFAPGLALACIGHETQYSRLFRS
jgi:urease accessory protein